jgi:hypothetical protein
MPRCRQVTNSIAPRRLIGTCLIRGVAAQVPFSPAQVVSSLAQVLFSPAQIV